jgi:hypothetical protein
MKRLLFLFILVVIFNLTYSQHHVYLGARVGAGYGNEMYKLTGLVFGSDYSPSLQIMQTHTMITNVNAVCADTKAEVLYGYKKFRVGYQFDYLLFKGVNYYSKLTPPETSGSQEIFRGSNTKLVEHFIGNSVLFEIIAFQKEFFSISPNLSIGYFIATGNAMIKSKNYIQTGAGLMFGFDVKQITLYINPDYTIRYCGEQYSSGTTFKNPFRLFQSVLINFGIRGDMLSLKKAKTK